MTEETTEVNLALVEKLMEWVKANRDHFDMSTYFTMPADADYIRIRKINSPYFDELEPVSIGTIAQSIETHCGTTGCMIGAALILSGQHDDDLIIAGWSGGRTSVSAYTIQGDMDSGPGAILRAGREALGLTESQAQAFASDYYWPTEYSLLDQHDGAIAILQRILDERGAGGWR